MNLKICLVCSSGGHFYELYCLKKFWSKYNRFWVTFPGRDTRYLLKDEKIYYAYHPTNRNIYNFFKNIFLAFKILNKERPDVILSTGAGVCVPFFYVGRLLGTKLIYIESICRINNLSLSAKLIYPFTKNILIQWPDLAKKYKKTEFKGQVL